MTTFLLPKFSNLINWITDYNLLILVSKLLHLRHHLLLLHLQQLLLLLQLVSVWVRCQFFLEGEGVAVGLQGLQLLGRRPLQLPTLRLENFILILYIEVYLRNGTLLLQPRHQFLLIPIFMAFNCTLILLDSQQLCLLLF